MKLEFKVNKYLLMWHLLYENSISMDIHVIKQKIWKYYKKEYSNTYKEKDNILRDLDNYIPDDDIIFNYLEKEECYKKIKQDTNRYRLSLLKIWDYNRKKYLTELNHILRYNLNRSCTVCVIDPQHEILETNFDYNIITVGKKLLSNDYSNFFTYLFYKILKEEFYNVKINDNDVISVILELITLNEMYTRMTKESKYNYGKKEYKDLKEKIYPYWLMYLGVSEKDLEKYMIRDNMFFIIIEYPYDSSLKGYDIFSFARFIIKNKRKILKQNNVGVEKISIESL